MNLHEVAALELDRVFFNLDEFACEHIINGKKMRCVVAEQGSLAQTRSGSDLVNISGLGIIQYDRMVVCNAANLVPQPEPGEKITMDGDYWLVGDSGVAEAEGLLRLPLVRAY